MSRAGDRNREIEALRGRIGAESAGPGRGARFTFTLPLAADAPGAAADRPAPGAGRGRERECILAVDDDPQTLRHVRDALAEAGYAPVVTGEQRDLGRIIRTEKPALVLLDLMLPGTDGIELMHEVPELGDPAAKPSWILDVRGVGYRMPRPGEPDGS